MIDIVISTLVAGDISCYTTFMYDVRQIGSLLGGGAGSSGSGLLGGLSSSDSGVQLKAMKDILSAAYARDTAAASVALSQGLEHYIAENVDENTAAKLLANLSAIRDMDSGDAGNAISDLLRGKAGSGQTPLLSLLA